jgi:hypothetical protein
VRTSDGFASGVGGEFKMAGALAAFTLYKMLVRHGLASKRQTGRNQNLRPASYELK